MNNIKKVPDKVVFDVVFHGFLDVAHKFVLSKAVLKVVFKVVLDVDFVFDVILDKVLDVTVVV